MLPSKQASYQLLLEPNGDIKPMPALCLIIKSYGTGMSSRGQRCRQQGFEFKLKYLPYLRQGSDYSRPR